MDKIKLTYFFRKFLLVLIMSLASLAANADNDFYLVSQDGGSFTLGFQGSINSESKWLTIYQVAPTSEAYFVPTFTNTMTFNRPPGTYVFELDVCIYDYWIGTICSSDAVPYGYPLPSVTVVVGEPEPEECTTVDAPVFGGKVEFGEFENDFFTSCSFYVPHTFDAGPQYEYQYNPSANEFDYCRVYPTFSHTVPIEVCE